ncbi:hypothetical protein D9C73_000860 [Collichthys lucidus]|uniref:Methyl-accepting transducer domain-containing protein n=1 Tax=Collichthys lucidus TaxID=240159 RepID=A0A4U5U194_COLLU|nr:hypothetical protein D9C73_000860 [Collichthys lucidus]
MVHPGTELAGVEALARTVEEQEALARTVEEQAELAQTVEEQAQTVEELAQTVKEEARTVEEEAEVAQTVEELAQTVEELAQTVEELVQTVEGTGEVKMVVGHRPVRCQSPLAGKSFSLMVLRLLKGHNFMSMLHRGGRKCVCCRERFLGQVQLSGEYSGLQQHVPVLPLVPPKQPTNIQQTVIVLYV